MRIKALILGGMAAGVALLAFAGPPREPGGVVLSRDSPEAPKWGLTWDLGKPAGQADGVSAVTHPGIAARQGARAGDAQPDIWATPAEFSEND